MSTLFSRYRRRAESQTRDDRPPDLGEMSPGRIGLALKSQLLAPRDEPAASVVNFVLRHSRPGAEGRYRKTFFPFRSGFAPQWLTYRSRWRQGRARLGQVERAEPALDDYIQKAGLEVWTFLVTWACFILSRVRWTSPTPQLFACWSVRLRFPSGGTLFIVTCNWQVKSYIDGELLGERLSRDKKTALQQGSRLVVCPFAKTFSRPHRFWFAGNRRKGASLTPLFDSFTPVARGRICPLPRVLCIVPCCPTVFLLEDVYKFRTLLRPGLSDSDMSFKMWTYIQRINLMPFASPTGLRSGAILNFQFEIVNRALMPVHLLAYRSERTTIGPCSLEVS